MRIHLAPQQVQTGRIQLLLRPYALHFLVMDLLREDPVLLQRRKMAGHTVLHLVERIDQFAELVLVVHHHIISSEIVLRDLSDGTGKCLDRHDKAFRENAGAGPRENDHRCGECGKKIWDHPEKGLFLLIILRVFRDRDLRQVLQVSGNIPLHLADLIKEVDISVLPLRQRHDLIPVFRVFPVGIQDTPSTAVPLRPDVLIIRRERTDRLLCLLDGPGKRLSAARPGLSDVFRKGIDFLSHRLLCDRACGSSPHHAAQAGQG